MKARVIVASNRAAAGIYADTSGPRLVAGLRELGCEVDEPVVVPDGDPVTEALRAIWCEVLKLDDVGDDEDLFDLGGHSLSITRMMTRIQTQLGADVPLDVFYDTPTVAEVAEYIRTECAGSLVGGEREVAR